MKKAFRKYLRQLGARGGRTAAARMTKGERRARAVKASRAAVAARLARKGRAR